MDRGIFAGFLEIVHIFGDGHDFMRFMAWSFRNGKVSKLYGVRSMAQGIGQKRCPDWYFLGRIGRMNRMLKKVCSQNILRSWQITMA